MKKKKVNKATLFNIAIMVLSVVMIVYFAFKESSIDDLRASLSTLNKWWLLLACLFMLFNWLMDALLIFEFTRTSVKEYKFKDAFRTAMVGQYFNSVTPFSSGGQPMQIYSMSRQGVDAGVAGATMMQKFIVWQACLTLFSFVFIIFRYQFFLSNVSGFMVVALMGFIVQLIVITFLFLFSLNPKITEALLKGIVWLAKKLRILKNPEKLMENVQKQLAFFHTNIKKMLVQKKLMAKTFAMTFCQYFSLLIIPYFVYRAFNLSDASLFNMLAANSFLTMIVSFVPLPGAAGASEGSFVMLFKMFFEKNPSGLMPAVLLWRIISFYSAIAIGAPFARLGKKAKEASESGDHTEAA